MSLDLASSALRLFRNYSDRQLSVFQFFSFSVYRLFSFSASVSGFRRFNLQIIL